VRPLTGMNKSTGLPKSGQGIMQELPFRYRWISSICFVYPILIFAYVQSHSFFCMLSIPVVSCRRTSTTLHHLQLDLQHLGRRGRNGLCWQQNLQLSRTIVSSNLEEWNNNYQIGMNLTTASYDLANRLQYISYANMWVQYLAAKLWTVDIFRVYSELLSVNANQAV
jgi:hypothetical protein